MGRLRTPGPGAYNVPTHLQFGTASRKASASFASNSKRQGRSGKDSTGDPGAYDIERTGVHLGVKEPMSARSTRSFNTAVNNGTGSFNSTSVRSASPAARSMRGGPGENDYSHMYSCGNSST